MADRSDWLADAPVSPGDGAVINGNRASYERYEQDQHAVE
jgi:hypothetical protein